MGRALPPLTALRAFDAAARHLSFARAAEELHVTPAAISQQVRALEDYLGVKLFRRLPRSVVITEAGQSGLIALREGLDKLAEAAELFRTHDANATLVVSVVPTFAAKWLVPRLDRFQALHPEIEVRVDASNRLIDFEREDVDLGIRYGSGVYRGLVVHRLTSGTEVVFPVCSPQLLEGLHPLRRLDDLRWHTLIHTDWKGQEDTWPNWRVWLRAAGLTDIDASRGPRFNVGALAAQAAVEGQGVALCNEFLAAQDLAEGRLVKPFELGVKAATHFAHYLVYPEAAARRPKVAAFCEWVLRESVVEQDEPSLGGARGTEAEG
ncbi:MAG: transcriptional regulator GcvA [Gammaproteobacteria bacterium]|nr:transcriptional regulator GcvA [Gammaproteobacteria bacterium]